MSATIIENGHAPAETLPAVIEPTGQADLPTPEAMEEAVWLVRAAIDGARAAHLAAVAARMRAILEESREAAQKVWECARLAATPGVRSYHALQDAKWAADQVANLDKEAARLAKQYAALLQADAKRKEERP